ncbi:hypothetical protein B9G55_22860 [Saccharibacillus sp. O16]|nr:hypothetical protein B9G55_22860 [Saccharibacillus sp. O16]
MGRKTINGICHICGIEGPLTFEHVPPRGAFNDKPVIKSIFENFMTKGPDEEIKGKIQQKGAGAYTLCASCNNDTGAWYGNAFIDWTYQSLILHDKSDGKGSIYYPFHIFPSRVLKQIITMFFSANGEGFAKGNPDLVRFVLNPEHKYVEPKIRIFAYLMTGSRMRQTGITGLGSSDGKFTIMSEIAFPPVGYVMTLNSDPPDPRLVEITHFSRYGYNEFETIFLRFSKLPVHLYLPGDYRNKDEIMKAYEENTKSID